MDAKPVKLPRPQVRKVTVPDLIGLLGQLNALGFHLGVRRIEQAQLDTAGVLGKQGYVDAPPSQLAPSG